MRCRIPLSLFSECCTPTLASLLQVVVVSGNGLKDDIAGSRSYTAMVRHNDPTGCKTIGVINKADEMRDPEAELALVEEEEHRLKLGWFLAVSAQGNPDLGHIQMPYFKGRKGVDAVARNIEVSEDGRQAGSGPLPRHIFVSRAVTLG
jgi:hypothetical protein